MNILEKTWTMALDFMLGSMGIVEFGASDDTFRAARNLVEKIEQ